MVQTILVPLDGLPLAERALPDACRLARATGAALLLVRAAHNDFGLTDPLAPRLTAGEQAEEYLQHMKRRLTRDGLRVRAKVVSGDPAEAILLAAALYSGDLIVMSTHGRSGVRRMVLGSVAETVLRKAAIPVLLVPARWQPGHTDTGPYRRILVPLDGTARAESALRYVAQESSARAAEVVLLYTLEPSVAGAPHAPMAMPQVATWEDQEADQRCREARDYLDTVANAYLPGRTWHAHVASGDPAAAIVDVARDSQAEVITMARHSRTEFKRLVHGSVAVDVLHQADAPVLLVPGSSTAAGDAQLAVGGHA